MAPFLLLVAITCSLVAAEPAFWDHDGLVVMEVESAAPSGQWSVDQDLTGFSGSAYYTWAGPNTFRGPGNGNLSYRVMITQPGTYQLRIHNRHDHPDSTLENDCFTRMDGGEWVKTFSSIRGQWTWHSRHEFSNSDKPEASYELSAGEHLFEINGRSSGYSIDRVHLFRSGTSGSDDVTKRETKAVPTLPDLSALPSIARHAVGGNWGKALQQAERDVVKASETQAVIDALTTFANNQHERVAALKINAPAAAVGALAELGMSFSGHDLGKGFIDEAKAWAKEPAVRQAIAADRMYAAMKEASQKLDNRGNATDEAWCKRNRQALVVIISGWRELQSNFAEAPAAGEAERMITRLNLRSLIESEK